MINGNDYIEWMSLLGIIPVKRVIHNGIIMSYIIRSSYPYFTAMMKRLGLSVTSGVHYREPALHTGVI